MQFTPRIFLGIIVFLGLFLFTNFEKTVGNLIILMGIGAWALYISDKNRLIEIQKNQISKSLLYGIGAYIFFIFTASIIGTFAKSFLANLNINLLSINSIIETFSETQLALQGNAILQFIAIGFLIALVETVLFFGPGQEFLMDLFNIKQLNFSISMYAIILIMASIFTYFHLTAKGVQNTESLVLVFYFAVLSMVLTILTKELLPAIFLHIFANSISSLSLLGISVASFGSIALAIGAIGIILYFTLKNVDIKRLFSGVGG